METNKLEHWKVLDASVIYNDPPFIRLEQHRIQLPTGQVVESYYRIELRSWVVMAAVTPERRCVIGWQYRHGIEKVSLMLPGGTLESGEAPLETAKRELFEETGYVSDEWEHLGHFVPNSNYRCGDCHLYLAKNAVKKADVVSDDLEETILIEMPLEEALDEIAKGNIISMSTVSALLLASRRL